jgi:protein-tyrosine phosphatase
MGSRSFSIVFICTGNRFRSPLARAFLERLTLGLPVEIGTAGTLDIGDRAALREAREIALSCGVDLSQHRSRALRDMSLEGVDLVLGFEEEHVRRAIVDDAAARSRSFRFRELVELLEHVSPVADPSRAERARKAIAAANELRRSEPSLVTGADVPDPFGRSWRVYRETAAVIRGLSVDLAERLFGVTAAAGLLPVPEKIRGRAWFRR